MNPDPKQISAVDHEGAVTMLKKDIIMEAVQSSASLGRGRLSVLFKKQTPTQDAFLTTAILKTFPDVTINQNQGHGLNVVLQGRDALHFAEGYARYTDTEQSITSFSATDLDKATTLKRINLGETSTGMFI